MDDENEDEDFVEEEEEDNINDAVDAGDSDRGGGDDDRLLTRKTTSMTTAPSNYAVKNIQHELCRYLALVGTFSINWSPTQSETDVRIQVLNSRYTHGLSGHWFRPLGV